MTIEEQLRNFHSKNNCVEVAKRAATNRSDLNDLLALLGNVESGVADRAAWALSFIPVELLTPHLIYLNSLLNKPLHVAVRRNVLRVFQETELPEIIQGELTDTCFRFLHSIEEPPAVKAFAMTVLYRICELQPDLKNELKITLEGLIPFGQPAVVSRGNRILKLLNKSRKIPEK